MSPNGKSNCRLTRRARRELARSRTSRVGRLQGMSAPATASAPRASASMNHELADQRLAGNLLLILHGRFGLFDLAAAMRTLADRHVDGFKGRIGLGRGPMTMGAVVLARLAAWTSRMRLGIVSGKGRRLPLGLTREAFDFEPGRRSADEAARSRREAEQPRPQAAGCGDRDPGNRNTEWGPARPYLHATGPSPFQLRQFRPRSCEDAKQAPKLTA